MVGNEQVDFTRFYLDSINTVFLEAVQEYMGGQEIPAEVTELSMNEIFESTTLADLMTDMG